MCMAKFQTPGLSHVSHASRKTPFIVIINLALAMTSRWQQTIAAILLLFIASQQGTRKFDKMDPAQTSNQGRIGLEGRGGSKVPGNMLSRTTFRYIFVGGMVAAGLTWLASSQGLLGSAGDKMNAASKGGSRPPTTTGKGKVDEAPSATSATKPSPQAHSGVAQGVSEGSKPK